MSGKKLISIIIGILFTQSLLSRSRCKEYLLVNEAYNSQYFVSVFVYSRYTFEDEIQTTLTHNGISYSTGVDKRCHTIKFYAESLEGGFSFTARGKDESGSDWDETISITKKDLLERSYDKMGANFAVQCTIVRKAKIEGFYPSIICTSNDNGYLSITLVSDSNESIGEVSGVIRIDGFR